MRFRILGSAPPNRWRGRFTIIYPDTASILLGPEFWGSSWIKDLFRICFFSASGGLFAKWHKNAVRNFQTTCSKMTQNYAQFTCLPVEIWGNENICSSKSLLRSVPVCACVFSVFLLSKQPSRYTHTSSWKPPKRIAVQWVVFWESGSHLCDQGRSRRGSSRLVGGYVTHLENKRQVEYSS